MFVLFLIAQVHVLLVMYNYTWTVGCMFIQDPWLVWQVLVELYVGLIDVQINQVGQRTISMM